MSDEKTAGELSERCAKAADDCDDARLVVDRRRASVIGGKEVCAWDALWDASDVLREAAAALARPVEDTNYHPGPPTVEQVRAHEKRGGRWQVMDPEGKRPGEAWLETLYVEDDDFVVVRGLTRDLALSRTKWAARSLYRPCAPDGTSCPWSDR